VGFWPSDLITVPNSLVVMVPSPSLSNKENASLNSVGIGREKKGNVGGVNVTQQRRGGWNRYGYRVAMVTVWMCQLDYGAQACDLKVVHFFHFEKSGKIQD